MTSFYLYLAGFITLYLILSILVIFQRRKSKIGLGGSDNPEHMALNRAIAAHGNFSQYVPLIILTCFILKDKIDLDLINGVMALALLGRITHAYGISQVKEKLIFRQMGMMMTFFSMMILIAFIMIFAI